MEFVGTCFRGAVLEVWEGGRWILVGRVGRGFAFGGVRVNDRGGVDCGIGG